MCFHRNKYLTFTLPLRHFRIGHITRPPKLPEPAILVRGVGVRGGEGIELFLFTLFSRLSYTDDVKMTLMIMI